MKMSFNAAQRRIWTLTNGGLGGILTDIETVEEIAAMPKHPTNYPTSSHSQRAFSSWRCSRWIKTGDDDHG